MKNNILKQTVIRIQKESDGPNETYLSTRNSSVETDSRRVMEPYDEDNSSPFTECILSDSTDVNDLFERVKEIVGYDASVKIDEESNDTYSLSCTMEDSEIVFDQGIVGNSEISFEINILRKTEDEICLQFKSSTRGKWLTRDLYETLKSQLGLSES